MPGMTDWERRQYKKVRSAAPSVPKEVIPEQLCENCGLPHLFTMGEVECRLLYPHKKVIPASSKYWPVSKHFTGG